MQGARVVFACVLGAFVGALVGLHFGHLWISIVTGASVGYFSYEWRTVVEATRTAWESATNWQPPNRAVASRWLRRWWTQSVVPWWKAYSTYCRISVIAHFGVTLILAVVVAWVIGFTTKGFCDLTSVGGMRGILIFQLLAATLPTLSLLRRFIQHLFRGRLRQYPDWSVDELKALYMITAAIAVWPLTITLLVVVLLMEAWKRLVVVGIFFKNLFVLVHSDIRLLCGIDAAVGAGVGYLLHNPLIGAVAGGLWGFLNYEILSIRVMKLIPAEDSILSRFQ